MCVAQMADKPVKWGFKLWCRCDAVSGYLYQFDLYTGRKTDTEYGLGEGVVIMLTNSLEQLCCQIFIDNFFSILHYCKSRCLRRKSTCAVQFVQTESICRKT